jgi:hypothetical protein
MLELIYIHTVPLSRASVIICRQKRVLPPPGGLISKIIAESVFSAVASPNKLESPGILNSGIILIDVEYLGFFKFNSK